MWNLKYVWPIQRKFVKKVERCQRCILSEDYAVIEDGTCNVCRNFVPEVDAVPSYSVEDLSRFIEERTCYSEYDATLLLSGGKDSAYILHRMCEDYPDFRLLCLIVNNGFMSKWAIPNARHITEKLNVDLAVVNSHVGSFKEAFRNAFLSLKGRGCYEVIDFADGSLIFKVGAEITRNLGIPLMISGLSWVQLERILKLNTFFMEQDGIEQLFPLAVWRTDEQDIRQYVRDRDLMLKGSDNPLVSNNRLVPTMIALDILNLGYSSFEPEFAQLIREGKSSRDVWLPIVELAKYSVSKGYMDKELKETLAKLDLTVEEVL